MMMQAQAPVSLTANQMTHGHHNLMFNHPMVAHSAAHIAAFNATKVTKDTTWTKLFVGGLPYETNDKELREFFQEFGEIDEAVVIIDRSTNKSKGYGFVSRLDYV